MFRRFVELFEKFIHILEEINRTMSTTNAGLANLQASVAKLSTDNAALVALFQQLLSNQQPGLQPGQVIVNQSDIDAIQKVTDAADTADVSASASAPAPQAKSGS